MVEFYGGPMRGYGLSRRTLLKGAAVAGGAFALGGLLGPLEAAGQPAVSTLPRLATLSHGYPAALDTGRALVAFAIGDGHRIWHRWLPAGDSWTGWRLLQNGPEVKGRPIPLLNANGAMSVFATDKDGKIWTGWQATEGGVNWSWTNLGSPSSSVTFVEEPFPVLNIDNAMSLFARATDGRIHHTYQRGRGGAWAGWQAFPTDGVGRPWAVIGPTGGMVVFARGANGGVVHRWQRFAGDTFSPAGNWAAIPGTIAINEDVTAIVNPTGAITVFAGSVNGVAFTWQKSAGGDWLGSWQEWTEHKILGRPSVVVGPTGGMALFAKRAGPTEENHLIHRSQPSWGANWSAWDQLEPVTTGEPSGVLGADGRLSAFARTGTGEMVYRAQDSPGGFWPIRSVFFNDKLEVG
ncbi:twin-arginine translocation signal domain-containing protein [Amycolatopsis sp. NPDC051758]|uniref:twin-arginine translocation signal domain-containing protein n=1 Tax=Amycolatopsis sp. NPDC051758 TaxID=3363935 RepID=UPI0037A57917